jgi:hypothetical protein
MKSRFELRQPISRASRSPGNANDKGAQPIKARWVKQVRPGQDEPDKESEHHVRKSDRALVSESPSGQQALRPAEQAGYKTAVPPVLSSMKLLISGEATI